MSSAGKIIAVVEDCDEDFGAFVRVFSTIAPVRRWASGEDAVRDLASGAVDLAELAILFVDLRLPGMDGVEVVERVRAMAGGADTKLVVMSSSAFEVDIVRALDAGVDEYEVKPGSLAELREIADRTARRFGLGSPRPVGVTPITPTS